MAKDGSLIFDTSINKEGFEKGVASLKSAGGAAMKVIGGAVAAAGTAMVGFGVYSTKASIEFETAFAGVAKVLDATANTSLQDLNDGIRDLSKRLPQTATEIAGVVEAAGQLGIGADDVLEFTETMIMLGDTTDLSSEQAATAFARISAVTGMSADNFDNLASVVVDLGNNFATTESEVVEMGMRLAGTSNQIGLSEAHMFGLAGAMSAVGINAEAGGSAMSRVMQKINTEVLSGGENLQGFADISGMSAETFSKTWKEKPDEAITAFVKGLDNIQKSGGDVTTALKDMGLNSMQEVDTLLRLSGASDQLVDALDISANAWEENTALLEEADVFYETTGAKIDMLKNNVTDLAISLGDGLKESLRGVIDTGMEMIDTLATGFEEGGFPGLVEALGTVVADVLVLLTDAAPQFLDMATNMIMAFISGIISNLPQIMESAIELVNSFINSVVTLLPAILTLGIEVLLSLIDGIAASIPLWITSAMELATGLIETIIEYIPLFIQTGMTIIKAFSEGVLDMLPTILEAGIDLLVALIEGVLENLPDIITMAFELIDVMISALINLLPMIIETGLKLLLGIIDGLINNIDRIIEAAGRLVFGIITGLLKAIPQLIASTPKLIFAIVKVFTGYNWGEIGKNLVKGIWNGISNTTQWILDKIKGFGNSVMKGIKGIFGIKSPSTKMRDQIGKNLALGLGEGIEDEMPSLQRDIDKQMKKLTAGMESTVNMETQGRGTIVTTGTEIVSRAAQSAGDKAVKEEQEELAQERVLISGNNFEIREESDIEKVAREILNLTKRKERGGN